MWQRSPGLRRLASSPSGRVGGSGRVRSEFDDVVRARELDAVAVLEVHYDLLLNARPSCRSYYTVYTYNTYM